jgi:hypothetical protein
VRNAHPTDVGCLAVSHELALIASASVDGALRVWDFQHVALDGDCSAALGARVDGGRRLMPTALEFVAP